MHIMNNESKCENCPACVVPYISKFYKNGKKRPKEQWGKTCRMNLIIDPFKFGVGERGFYAPVDPEHCEGPNGRKYYWHRDPGSDWKIEYIDCIE